MNTPVNESPENNEVVCIGNDNYSMKQIQSLYHEITGKKEQTTINLKNAHQITFEDIDQLNTKITQLYEQYHMVSQNCSVIIYYVNDQKDQFSTFDRSKIMDSSSNSPCENVTLIYKFLIKLPETNTPQSYTIQVNLLSRVGIREKALVETGMTKHFLFRMLGRSTGKIEIEYVDYTVARTFRIAIEEWYKSVKFNAAPKWLLLIQGNSHIIPLLFWLALTAFSIFAIHNKAESFISNSPDFLSLFLGSTLAFGTVIVVGKIAHQLGSFFERTIDSYQPISFVKLNRGDEKAIDSYNKSFKRKILALGGTLLGAITVAVIVNFITSIIGIS